MASKKGRYPQKFFIIQQTIKGIEVFTGYRAGTSLFLPLIYGLRDLYRHSETIERGDVCTRTLYIHTPVLYHTTADTK